MKIKYSISFLLLLTMFVSCRSVRPALRVGVSPDHAPICFVAKNGDLAGVEIDFANHLGEFLKKDIQFVPMPFEKLNDAVEFGQVDIAMSGISVTAERARRVSFSKPYMTVSQMMLVRQNELGRFLKPGKGYYKNNEMLVGVVHGTTGADLLNEHLSRKKIVYFENVKMAVGGLRNKEIDVIMCDSPIVWEYTNNQRNPDLAGVYWPINEEKVAWAISRHNTHLLSQVNRFYFHMRYNGDLKRVLSKWIPRRVSFR